MANSPSTHVRCKLCGYVFPGGWRGVFNAPTCVTGGLAARQSHGPCHWYRHRARRSLPAR
jgi:hypothetical protein